MLTSSKGVFGNATKIVNGTSCISPQGSEKVHKIAEKLPLEGTHIASVGNLVQLVENEA